MVNLGHIARATRAARGPRHSGLLETFGRVDFINDHREEFGVEPICRVLAEHGIKIAPSTFYEVIARRPSKRVLRDAELVALIESERARQKLLARFGARKMWLHLRGKGHDVARCTVER